MIRYEICGNNNTEPHALKLGPRSHRPPCILFTYTVGTIELLHIKTSLFPTPAASVFVEQSLSKSVLMAFASLSLEVKKGFSNMPLFR